MFSTVALVARALPLVELKSSRPEGILPYCPVSFANGGSAADWDGLVPGNEAILAQYDGAVYCFASEAKRASDRVHPRSSRSR